MKELSLHILDVAQNAAEAEASLVRIDLRSGSDGWLTLSVADDGKGMSQELLSRVTDPFCTTRTTRRVGMGLPLLKLAAEQTGGWLRVESLPREEDPARHGTTVTAAFRTRSVDCPPLGDVVSTVCTLVQGYPEIDWAFRQVAPGLEVSFETKALRKVLGPEVSLGENEVILWIGEHLRQQYENES